MALRNAGTRYLIYTEQIGRALLFLDSTDPPLNAYAVALGSLRSMIHSFADTQWAIGGQRPPDRRLVPCIRPVE